ncbi:hypothetical protein NQ176_g4066 [Zarea fungicola]|uniref:Uncharacterized protein n=1 Tax=Zarea fungicola TaxID=93591 RepID=A0ACC1NFC4_9HYPO|nr:hypothetical protein NQ176_g4066 [Lecanicillium fungicola]
MVAEVGEGHLRAASAIARTCSVFSLLGCLFVIITFCTSKAFHQKPINRLVFYASFGNIMINIGTLMSRTYVDEVNSSGCQFQGFLLQMFLSADAYWTLAMAFNVYLTFYYKFDAARLRKMELYYFLFCYGVPGIPSIVFLFIKNSHGTRIYGNALLWCWIAPQFQVLRIASVYGPIWLVILCTFFIYIRAGRTIYMKRKQLQDFHSSDPDPLSVNGDAAIYPVKTTEVMVTSEPANRAATVPRDSYERAYTIQVVATNSANSMESAKLPPRVHVEADETATTTQPAGSNNINNNNNARSRQMLRAARRRNHELHNAAWSYTKCADPLLHGDPHHVDPVDGEPGFWNALIYVVISWAACKSFWHDLRHRPASGGATELAGLPRAASRLGRLPYHPSSAAGGNNGRRMEHVLQRSTSKHSNAFSTESAEELNGHSYANSRY